MPVELTNFAGYADHRTRLTIQRWPDRYSQLEAISSTRPIRRSYNNSYRQLPRFWAFLVELTIGGLFAWLWAGSNGVDEVEGLRLLASLKRSVYPSELVNPMSVVQGSIRKNQLPRCLVVVTRPMPRVKRPLHHSLVFNEVTGFPRVARSSPRLKLGFARNVCSTGIEGEMARPSLATTCSGDIRYCERERTSARHFQQLGPDRPPNHAAGREEHSVPEPSMDARQSATSHEPSRTRGWQGGNSVVWRCPPADVFFFVLPVC